MPFPYNVAIPVNHTVIQASDQTCSSAGCIHSICGELALWLSERCITHLIHACLASLQFSAH
jgi:hypothetical protein